MKCRTISSVGFDPSSKYMSIWLMPACRKNWRSYLSISCCYRLLGTPAYRSLFSLTTNPTFSSLNTFMTHRNVWFGYRLFALPLAMVLAAAKAARLAFVGLVLATSCLTHKSSIGDANGTNGPRTLRSPFLPCQLTLGEHSMTHSTVSKNR